MTEPEVVAEIRRSAEDRVPLEVAGAGTLLDVMPGPPPCRRLDLATLSGVTSYDPADLRVTAAAGTRIEELAEALDANAQECPIEGPGSTLGGRIASGLSGTRRLGAGPIRDWVLGARVVTAAGSVVALGGGTVKNVTGYDLVRLLCGSWGTLGVLVEVTLRVRPRPAFRQWYVSEQRGLDTTGVRGAASVLLTRERVHVLLEGQPEDCRDQAWRHALAEGVEPRLPAGARLSVPPACVVDASARIEGDFVAEAGVGIIHANPPDDALPALREYCESVGGRLLVLRRGTGVPAFGGRARGDLDLRVKQAFDPDGLLAPWRFAA